MEAEAAEQKKDFDPEATGAHKTPGKLSEKKRRRSHTAEGSESDVPSKIRKTSESEGGEREKDGAQSSKSSLSHQCKKKNGTAICHFTSSLFLIFKVKLVFSHTNQKVGCCVNSVLPLIESPTHRDAQQAVEKGKENRDDSTIKAKRKRKKKHKEKLKIGEEVIPLRVLSKYEPASLVLTT